MIILSQNCRGLGRAKAQRSLKGLIKTLSPDILFLSEVKTSKESVIKDLLNRVGYPNFYFVPPEGKAGGLILSWKKDVSIVVEEACKNFIVGRVTPDPPDPPWQFTGVYGPSIVGQKQKFWDKLDKINSEFEGGSLFIGDFNSVLTQDEKRGGRPFASSSSGGLQEVIHKNGLIDLGFEGPSFTWSNRQGGGKNIKERLDRGLVNSVWNINFPSASVTHLAAETSDHAPLLLRTLGLEVFRPRPFRFEAMWTRDNTCGEVVIRAWESKRGNNAPAILYSALEIVQKDLKVWNKKYFGNCTKLVNMFREKIRDIQAQPHCDQLLEMENKLQEELDENLLRLEIMWRQKSRSDWLEAGDDNTKYFHLSTIINRRMNQINCIKGDTNVWINDRGEIGKYFVNYFEKVFTSTKPVPPPNLRYIMKETISREENSVLCRKPEEDEIKRILWDMGSQKSPGPDGMPPFFYKFYWDIVKEDIIKFVQHFFVHHKIGEGGNHTFITLIKKQDKPSKPEHLRPISLCNVSYKIVSKIIACRLKKLLAEIISPNQSAFVPGRNITDNSIVSHELMHFLHNHKGKQGFMAIRVDMEKAYDRVEWDFLLQMMSLLGFEDSFIQMIRECISSTSFSVLINGSPEGFFKPTRGIRQGDPLSPYLFLIYFEILSRMLQMAEDEGHLKGIKVCRTAPSFNHLMYADDLVIFCRASLEDAAVVDHILELFGSWSGQKVNKNKSSIHFGNNVGINQKQNICYLMGLKECNHTDRHLGLPFCKGKRKKAEFDFVVEKVKNRLAGWRGKVLSQASRVVLIRSVMQALPSYCMQSFNLPISICDQVDGLARRFFWGVNEGKKNYMALVAWDKVALPKSAGGLGFRKMADQNSAFTAKLTWQMFDPGKKDWSKMFKAKYLRHRKITDVIEVQKGSSWIWQAVCSNVKLIKDNMCCSVGLNSLSFIWEDAWIPGWPGHKPPLHLKSIDSPNIVSELFTASREWNIDKIRGLFPREICEEISKIAISSSMEPQAPIWMPSKTGLFTVKSAYYAVIDRRLNTNASISKQVWKNLWNAKLQGRHMHLLWRVFQKAMPVKDRVHMFTADGNTDCVLCNDDMETIDHLFLHCHVMKGLMFKSKWGCRLQDNNITLREWMSKLIDPQDKTFPNELNRLEFLNFFMVTIDQVWRVRNQIIFKREKLDMEELHQTVFKVAEDYWRAQLKKMRKHEMSGIELEWVKPDRGWYKFNSDAAVSNGNTCIAWVARNELGNIVGAFAECYQTITVDEAEGKALMKAVEYAVKVGIKKTIFESDSSNVISAILEDNVECEWQAKNSILKTRSLCNQMAQTKFRKIPRQCNKLAHNLAAWGKIRNWKGVIPLIVFPLSITETRDNTRTEIVREFWKLYN